MSDWDSERAAKRLVIVGTGTGVGKTHVTCALLAAALRQGRSCLGLKPVETGIVEGAPSLEEDGERLRAGSAAVFHVKQKAPYRFLPPISPHLAARLEGVTIDPARIREYVESADGEGTILVETAGGLFSPLGRGLTNLDVVRALEPCRVVLVAGDRLGVLHDVAATIGYARALGREPDLVVLSGPAEADASTGTNASELAWLGTAQVVATFPREGAESVGSLAAAEAVWSRIAELG